MYNTASFGKRAFTMAIVFATILWSVGVSFFVMPSAARAADVSDGDLIKGSLSTVYYYWDGERYTFPNEKTFMTWFADFDDVTEISDEDLADIPLAGNVVYRSGTYMIKIDSDPKTYAVGPDGEIHWVESEEVAEDLFGSDWNQWIQDVPDVFFTDYTEGTSLMEAELVEGMMIESDDVTYIYWDGELSELSEDGMEANRLWDMFVLTESSVDISGYTTGDAIEDENAALSDAAQMAEEEADEEEEGGEGMLEVSLSDDSPDSSTIVAGQAIADMAHFTFENDGEDDVTVTSLSLKRLGVSGDTTLSSVYLFDGYTRLTDSASVSSGVITFNDSSGLFTVAAGDSGEIAVRADIASSTSGQTVGVSIEEMESVTGSADEEVDGDFPLEGELHTIASVSNFGGFNLNSTTTPSAATVDPQTDLTLWQNTVSITNNKQDIYSLRFRQIGSINSSDVENFRLYVDGTQAGDAVEGLDDDGYVTFDLSEDPVEVQTGSRVIKVLADVINGSGRTVQMSLRTTADVFVMDQVYGQPILSQVNSSTFSASSAGIQTINSGTMTFASSTSSPSGNVTNNSSSATLGIFDVKAFGEDMKVEFVRVTIDEGNTVTTGDDDTSGADSIYTLRNGALYADGVQVGSTAAIAGDGDATLAYTQYNLGSSLVVSPGEPIELTVKADIYDSDTTNDVDATDTIQAEIVGGSSLSNVLRKSSNSYGSFPSANVEANTLTVAEASLTVASNTSFASQTVVAPVSGQKMASFSITSTTTEAVNINTFSLDMDGVADAFDASDDLTNLYITYGETGTENTSSVKGSVADTSNSWSVNYSLAAGTTMYVNVYADVPTSSTDGDSTADTLRTDLTVTGTGASSAASAAPSEVSGQTITSGSGTLTATLDGSTSVNKIVAADQEVSAAIFRFTSQNEKFTVRDVTVSVSSTTVASAVGSVRLYDGSTLLGSAPIGSSSSTAAVVNGEVFSVSSNSYKQITVKYVLNEVGTGAGSSQVNAAATLASYVRQGSTGSQTSVTTTCSSADCAGNEVYVYKTIPTIALVDLTNSGVSNGSSTDLYKFTVSANSNGSVALKQVRLSLTWSDGATGDTLTVGSLRFYKDGSEISSSVSMQDEDANSASSSDALSGNTALGESDDSLYITWTTEDVVSAGSSVTYLVRGTPSGFHTTGTTSADIAGSDTISFALVGDSAHNSTAVCLNTGTATTSIIKLLAESSSDCSATASGSATTYNFTWSDSSSSTHQNAMADYSGSSDRGDWANGYRVLDLDLSSETWAP